MIVGYQKQHRAMQDLKDISDGVPWFVDEQIDKLQSLYRSLDIPNRNKKTLQNIERRPPTYEQVRRRIIQTPFNPNFAKKNQQQLSHISRSFVHTAKPMYGHINRQSQFNSTHHSKFFSSNAKKIKVKSDQLQSPRKPMQFAYTKLRKAYQKQFYVNGKPILRMQNPQSRKTSRSKRGKIVIGRPKFRINQKSIYI